MKIVLENREFEIRANGYFMKKYQEAFEKSNFAIDLFRAIRTSNMLLIAQLTYCAIQNCSLSFDEWLNSFETPCFINSERDRILEYLTRDTKPTVEPEKQESNEQDSKKK